MNDLIKTMFQIPAGPTNTPLQLGSMPQQYKVYPMQNHHLSHRLIFVEM